MAKKKYPYGMTRSGNLVRILMVARFWKDGDTSSWLWNWWNPLAWPVAAIILLVGVAMHGLGIFTREDMSDLGFCLSDWWREHKDEREFLPPFSRPSPNEKG